MKKLLVILLLLLISAAVAFYLYRSYLYRMTAAEVAKKLPEIAKNLDFELDNVKYTHTRSGVKKWELSSRKAKRVKGENKIILEGVEAWIYPRGKLKSETHVLADSGSYQVETGDISLSGNVRIANKDLKIVTDELSYNESQDHIDAPGKVSVNNDTLSIKALRAQIDLKKQQIIFSGRVKTRLYLNKIKSGKAQLLPGSQR